MAVLVALPHAIALASALHMAAGGQAAAARSRLRISAVLASYAPVAVLVWLLFGGSAQVDFGVFLALFTLGPIVALIALGFFVAARIGAEGGRRWDAMALGVAAVIGTMTYIWASRGPSG